jgi:microcystin-dependent protein
MVLGYDERTENTDNPGVGVKNYALLHNKGGAVSVTLSTAQAPSHVHGHGATKGGKFVLASGNATVGTGSTTRGLQENSREYVDFTAGAGGGQAHENRPEYYVLAFIIKTV